MIDESGDEEIIIKARERNEKIIYIENIIKNATGQSDTLLLSIGLTQYFIPIRDILFIESLEGKTSAHTRDKIFYSSYKLYELEKILPNYFCRASKSSIVNIKPIYSIKKNITGASEVSFKECAKKAYLSRSYYKLFMEKINETRLGI